MCIGVLSVPNPETELRRPSVWQVILGHPGFRSYTSSMLWRRMSRPSREAATGSSRWEGRERGGGGARPSPPNCSSEKTHKALRKGQGH